MYVGAFDTKMWICMLKCLIYVLMGWYVGTKSLMRELIYKGMYVI